MFSGVGFPDVLANLSRDSAFRSRIREAMYIDIGAHPVSIQLEAMLQIIVIGDTLHNYFSQD